MCNNADALTQRIMGNATIIIPIHDLSIHHVGFTEYRSYECELEVVDYSMMFMPRLGRKIKLCPVTSFENGKGGGGVLSTRSKRQGHAEAHQQLTLAQEYLKITPNSYQSSVT